MIRSQGPLTECHLQIAAMRYIPMFVESYVYVATHIATMYTPRIRHTILWHELVEELLSMIPQQLHVQNVKTSLSTSAYATY